MNGKVDILGHFLRAVGHLAAGAERSGSDEGRADSSSATSASSAAGFDGAPTARAKPISRPAKPSCCVAKRPGSTTTPANPAGGLPGMRGPKR